MNVPVFAHLAWDELKRTWRTPWMLVAVVVLCGSGWTAIRLGQRDFREQQRVYADQLQTRLQVQVHYPTQVTGRGPEPGLRVLRPPNPSAVLVQGQDRTLPAAWEMTPAGPEALAPYISVGRRLEGGGTWDIEVLIRVFGGFLAVGLGLYGVIGDRISGWVHALESSPIGSRQSSLARLFGGSLMLVGFASLWWIVIGTALTLGQPEPPVSLRRLLWMLPVVVAYLSVFLAIGVACAWRARGTLQAVFSGMAFWLVIGVFGPALVGLVGEIVQPLPAQASFEQARREQYADDLRAIDQAIAKRAAVALSPTVPVREQDHLVDAKLELLDDHWQVELLRARASVRELEAEWKARLQFRRRLAAALNWLSPGGLFRDAMAELAGTGTGHAQMWEDAVEGYQTAINRSLFDDRPAPTLRIDAGETAFQHTQIRHQAPRFGDLPRFEIPETSWRTRLSGAKASLLGLAVWLVATVVAAWSFGSGRNHRAPYGIEF